MKFYYLFLLTFGLLSCRDSVQKEKPPVQAETRPVVRGSLPGVDIDKSQMDLAYLPSDYPLQKMNGSAGALPVARILYSRPHKEGRMIFGDSLNCLVQFGKPWRLGANESTELELFRACKLGNQTVPAGKYSLYCIPEKDHWTLIVSSNLYSWGLHMDSSKDLYRIRMQTEKTSIPFEHFTIQFEDQEGRNWVWMAWDTVKARVGIQTDL